MGRWTGGRRTETLLNLGTATVVLAAVAHLAASFLLPALRSGGTLERGERLTRTLTFRTLADGADLSFTGRGPALLLVYQSHCPSCHAILPAWREILDARDPSVRVYGVGLEPEAEGLRFARRHLPEALAVRPADERRFADAFGLEAVPTTLLLDADGRLRIRVGGPLTGADLVELLRLVGGDREGATAARHRLSTDHRLLVTHE